MNIKQRKIKIEPKTKLNYNRYINTIGRIGGNVAVHISVDSFKTKLKTFLFKRAFRFI